MTHQWLAEWFFPESVIDEVVNRMHDAQDKQVGIESKWKDDPIEKANNDFYAMFDEIDKASLESYLAEHPECKRANLMELCINEAGINDDGTTIMTKQGDQILAIDGKNKLMLVRVKGSGYQGVLAILKSPEDLRCCPAQKPWLHRRSSGKSGASLQRCFRHKRQRLFRLERCRQRRQAQGLCNVQRRRVRQALYRQP